ncbi:XRE family transcriptional regulator [Streptomyces triticagri]|uniref:XRE family transcriptional regulator n=1 Tax=Streptomyces triticagri TaxID=2293568 RepID=A0A372LY36_9ACTN|nr:helix-turn-helix transcriptional regulator [Streptomyces triticagri]RFU83584.1 XRE family transcriptional regulator [Streptomyces triticagri]
MTTTRQRGAARFALSVKMAAKAGKCSQAEMGAYMGISRDAMAQKLGGRVRFNLDEAYALAELFGVEPGRMVDGAGEWLDEIDPDGVRKRLEETAGQGLIGVTRK